MRVRRDVLEKIILTTMFHVALWRATSMWYGYPARFDEGQTSVDPTVMKLVLYSLIPLIGIHILLKPAALLRAVMHTPKPIIGVMLFSLVSIWYSQSMAASLRGAAAVILISIPPILYRQRYGGPETYRQLVYFSIASAYLNLAYTAAFPGFAIMRGSYDGMVKGLFYHKNILGQFSAVAVIAMICNFPRPIRINRFTLLYAGAIVLTLGLIVLSRSSTAVVMVGVGLGMIGVFYIFQRLGNMMVRTMAITFLTVGLFALGSAVYIGLVAEIAQLFGKDITFSGRTNIWDQLIPLIYQKPIFGYGFALFRQPEVMAQYVRVTFDARSTHNTYLELALNIGIPGTLLWIAFLFARLFRKIMALYITPELKRMQLTDIAVIVLVAVGAFMEAGFMLAPLVLWVVLVTALAQSRVERQIELETRDRRAGLAEAEA